MQILPCIPFEKVGSPIKIINVSLKFIHFFQMEQVRIAPPKTKNIISHILNHELIFFED